MTTVLYDYRGEKIDLAALQTEQAVATLAGIRNIARERVADGLSPQRLASILRQCDEGDPRGFLTLAHEMELRDWHYASVLGQRKQAVSGLDVTVHAGAEDAKGQELAQAIRELGEAPEFRNLLADLLDALGKGFSAVEIKWDRTGTRWTPAEYEYRDPRWFTFDRVNGTELRLLDESAPVEGLALQPYKWLIHRPRLRSGLPRYDGFARLVAGAYCCKSFTLKDWLAFAEVFGMPLRLGRYGPSAKADDIEALINAVANLGTDAAAVIPDSMKIEFEAAVNGAGGDKLFQGLADWLDKQVSKAVVGQTMTTDDGSSLGQAKIHNEVRMDLVRHDAFQLEVTLNKFLVRPFIDLNFGRQQRYPRFSLVIEEPDDLELISKALAPMIDRGLRVEQSAVREMFGFAEPAKDAELLHPANTPEAASAAAAPAPARNSVEPAQYRDPIDELVNDELADWQPIMDPVLKPIVELVKRSKTVEEFQAGLKGLQTEMGDGVLVEKLASAMFKSHMLGAAKD